MDNSVINGHRRTPAPDQPSLLPPPFASNILTMPLRKCLGEEIQIMLPLVSVVSFHDQLLDHQAKPSGFEENKKEFRMFSDQKAMVEKPTHEWGKGGKNVGRDQGAFGQELNKNKYRATPMVNEGFENGKKTGTGHSSMLEGKGNSKRLAQHVNTSQSTERIWNAVERDTLEFITERVYAESPEREAVDRESAEARRRIMAVTRKILEKKCAEAREKLLAEKRMAKKTASVGNFEGVEGESAQRCKSRLERQQAQTRECVAKALAEKNKRDRQAEREQAERDSIAESVDAEVEMWSSRKDLPALISTLQYILWTNSGWEPIPLKDVKTTSAVRQAYRKAVLFIHPDKLQHGATIKQKYIGEKVFYRLKEARIKFNPGAQWQIC